MPFDRAQWLLSRFCDSYERLGELIAYSGIMARRPWLKLLGEEWSAVDNLWEWRAELQLLLPARTCLLMMDHDERERWRELPDVVTIYRGCSSVNSDGVSWSLDRSVAVRFPNLMRYRPPEGCPPQLVTAVVPRSRIVAVELGREEDEVITCHARPVAMAAI
jgi:hypothetical protein